MQTAATRRQFLHTSAVATAALATLPAAFAADAAPKKREIKKAIMWGTVGVKGSVLEKMKLVKAAGFEGVEPNSHMNQDDVIAALKETGLKAASVCCGTHWNLTLSSPSEDVRAKGLAGLVQSLRDAKAYGATSVLLVPGVVNAGATYEQCFERSVEQIKKAIPTAQECGVKIAIENVWNNFITKPQQADDFLKAINSEWVAWHFDIGNVGRYSPAEEWIPVIGKRIFKLHIKEYSTKLRDEKGPGAGFGVKFLEGTNNWPAIMAALDKIGYSGWGIAEQGGGGSPEGLKDLADRMDKIFAS